MRAPIMSDQEFADLEAERGVPFLSQDQAQDYRVRRNEWNQIETMMESKPNVSTRRVERELPETTPIRQGKL